MGLLSWILACMGGGGRVLSQDEVLDIVGVTLPADATEVQATGDPGGMDAIAWLQFIVPDMAAARAVAAEAGCEPAPVVRLLDDPFERPGAGDPPWWVAGPHPGALACQYEDGRTVGSLRLAPLEDGRVRVQIAAVR